MMEIMVLTEKMVPMEKMVPTEKMVLMAQYGNPV